MAEGASGVHASGPSRIGLPPAACGVVGPLRPACASCTPSLATPYWRQKSYTRLRAVSLSSDHMPAHFGEMRPCGLTFVISHITRPAAPSDILPRCIRCQSLAEPLLELYWHMGETTTLFGRVRPRMVMGENRTLAIGTLPFSAENSDTGVMSVHGNDQTADRPEHTIFDAADDPDPAPGDLVGRGTGDEQMDERDECDILQIDPE